MKICKRYLLLFFLFSCFEAIYAQPGSNDFSFNVLDSGVSPGTLCDGTIYATSVQPDGKIIIAGNFTSVSGVNRTNIARLNPNGTVDPSFAVNYGNFYTTDFTVRSLILEENGAVLVSAFSGSSGHVFRVEADGISSSTLTSTNGEISGIRKQSDGKIIIVGSFTQVHVVTRKMIARLKEDGSVDQTFDPMNSTNSNISTVAIQSDDKILISGAFSVYNGISSNRIARLNSDASLDMTFNPGTGANMPISAIAVQEDGKILIGGSFSSVSGTNLNAVARLNTNGEVDGSFTVNNAQNTVYAIAVQSDGNILISGRYTNTGGTFSYNSFRVDQNGDVDNSLISISTSSPTYSIYSGMNEFVLGGGFTTVNGLTFRRIAKFNSNGTFHDTFNSGTGANNSIYTASLQPDGKIIVGGGFTTINSTYQNRIARLNADGSLDNSFDPGSGADIFLFSSAVQADGKIIIGGNFTTYNNTPINRIARLNPDGSLDPTFDPGTGADDAVLTIVIQEDGKILIGGEFTTFNNSIQPFIARLNTDGSLDATFDIETGFSDFVNCIVLQPDGKILAGGNFMSFNGVGREKIARLEPDGSLDVSFSFGSGTTNYVYSLLLQPDGKVIACGNFTSLGGSSYRRIGRLNANGSIDNSFQSVSTEMYSSITSVVQKPNGKLIIAGIFTSLNSIPFKNLACLNSDGSVDTTFYSGTGTDAGISDLLLQPDGRLIMSGSFTIYNGIARNRIARLLDCFPFITTTNVSVCQSYYWPQTGITYTQSGVFGDTLTGVAGCDSIISLNLTIIPLLTTENISTCEPYYWAQTGITYTESGVFSDTMTSAGGCDSICVLNLTMFQQSSMIVNTFSLPSDIDNCTGQVAVTISGNPDFGVNFGDGALVFNSTGYSVIEDQCGGIYTVKVSNNCGDTLSETIVIPTDSNFVFNNGFIDSLAQDSLGVTLENCSVYYNSISEGYIDSLWAVGNTVHVIWNIVDANGLNTDTVTYELNNGNGVYWLQLSIFCPNKSEGQYFSVTQSIYFENGAVSTLGTERMDKKTITLFPNPTSDKVTIHFEENAADLIIRDINGKQLSSEQISSNKQIDLSGFANGVYLFEISTEKGRSVKRVVKN